jgi:hypothetical protein
VFSFGVDPRLYNDDYRPARVRIEGVSKVGGGRYLRREGKEGIRL